MSVRHENSNLAVPTVGAVLESTILLGDHSLGGGDEIDQAELGEDDQKDEKVATSTGEGLDERVDSEAEEGKEHYQSPSVDELLPARDGAHVVFSTFAAVFLLPALHLFSLSTEENVPRGKGLLVPVSIASVLVVHRILVLLHSASGVPPGARSVVIVGIVVVLVVVLVLGLLVLSLLVLVCDIVTVGRVILAPIHAPLHQRDCGGQDSGKEPDAQNGVCLDGGERLDCSALGAVEEARHGCSF